MKRKPVVNTVTPMKRSYLVQRLHAPYKSESSPNSLMNALENALAFGGGLKNGGLSDDAMGLLRDIFRFDYMGSSEFEWGAVPKALTQVAKNANNYKAFEFVIPLSSVAKNWSDKSTAIPTGVATIYVICDKSHIEEVKSRICSWAADGHRNELKERTNLSSALRPIHEWDKDVCGWLELNNGFFFFTDRDMWEKTARLFRVAVDS